MSSGPRTPGPRHMAGGARRVALPAAVEAELDPTEIAPVVRVKRSRLAFAVSITLAALPILVLDNLPASAARAEQVGTEAMELTTAPTEESPSTTSTTAAPTTTAAPAPPPVVTTPPPTTTTTAAPVRQAVATVQSPPATQAPAPPPPAAPAKRGDPNDPATWDQMAQCEAGGNWSINSGNGYYGGLQFSLATWQHYGGSGYPHQASKATQITIGKKLQAAKGWSAWPGCARRLGFV